MHPVITKITSRSANEYLAYESLSLGFISFSFSYPVFLSQNNKDKTVKMKAKVLQLTTIEIDFKLKYENGFTEVKETVNFKTMLPIKGKMENLFKKYHTKIFENIGEIN